MSRKTIIYGAQGVAIGPAPNSGFHFIDYTGELNNDIDNYPLNNDLLMDLGRVNSISYSFGVGRTDVFQLGKRGSTKRAVINSPTVELGISYYLAGFKNESRIGLNVNYPLNDWPNSGEAFYQDNYNVNLLKRLDGRTLDQPESEPYWPHPDYQDRRNIFIGIAPKGEDLVNVGPQDMEVHAFGNCYLSSYSLSMAVGQIPNVDTAWICENSQYYTNGSGQSIPTLDAKTRTALNHIKFNMPDFNNKDGEDIGALLPGNIKISVSGVTDQQLYNFGQNINSLCITSANLSFELDREPLDLLEYKLPIDRQINYPVIANLSLATIVGEIETGSLEDVLNEDDQYDVSLEMYNNCPSNELLCKIDLKKSKYEGSSFSNNIGGRKSSQINFSVELDPDNLDHGLFMSGDLKINKLQNYLLDENGGWITDDSGNRLISDVPSFY